MIHRGSRVLDTATGRRGIVTRDVEDGQVTFMPDHEDNEYHVLVERLREVAVSGAEMAARKMRGMPVESQPAAIHDELVMAYAHDTGVLKSSLMSVLVVVTSYLEINQPGENSADGRLCARILSDTATDISALKTGMPVDYKRLGFDDIVTE